MLDFRRADKTPPKQGKLTKPLKALKNLKNFLRFLERNGAGDEIRTHDINLGKVALYP